VACLALAFINPCEMRFSLAAEPPQQRIVCTDDRDKPLAEEMLSLFPELVRLVVVAVPADYTRFT